MSNSQPGLRNHGNINGTTRFFTESKTCLRPFIFKSCWNKPNESNEHEPLYLKLLYLHQFASSMIANSKRTQTCYLRFWMNTACGSISALRRDTMLMKAVNINDSIQI